MRQNLMLPHKGKTKVTSYDVAVSDAGWKVITNA